MRSIVATSLAAALVAVAIGAGATGESVVERNREWFLERLGVDALPEGDAEVHVNGVATRVSSEEAMRQLLERAGGVDLAAVAASAGEGGDPFAAGDAWVIQSVRAFSCSRPTILGPGAPETVREHEQMYVYEGHLGYVASPNEGGLFGEALVLDWTTKLAHGGYASEGVGVVGNSDWFCASWWIGGLFFPFIDGYVCDLDRPECVIP